MDISRRNFLKNSIIGLGSIALHPWKEWRDLQLDWPDTERMGRNCTGGMVNLRAKPSVNSAIVKPLYEDTIVVWLQEVIGEAPPGVLNKRWVETPEGYIYLPVVQPVYNHANQPVEALPITEEGQGMWAEVTVPYVDIYLEKAPCSPWLQEVQRPRLYYSQILWVDSIDSNSQGQILYRVNEKFGNCGDVYWAAAEAFRPLTEEELTPIHPEAEEKRIVVNLSHQGLSCYEGSREVYYCRVSTGARFDYLGNPIDEWSTPPGAHLPWRKSISIHMAGGSTGAGYDTPGIGWTILFDPDGAAIHSTFWHNDFGVERSHGCVNARPEDAKWIFRWSIPHVQYSPGDVTLSGPGGTIVDVIES